MSHSHYFKNVNGLATIDVYRVLERFGVTDPALQHAIKKLLVAGERGAKDTGKDVQEAIDSLLRYQVMQQENLLLGQENFCKTAPWQVDEAGNLHVRGDVIANSDRLKPEPFKSDAGKIYIDSALIQNPSVGASVGASDAKRSKTAAKRGRPAKVAPSRKKR